MGHCRLLFASQKGQCLCLSLPLTPSPLQWMLRIDVTEQQTPKQREVSSAERMGGTVQLYTIDAPLPDGTLQVGFIPQAAGCQPQHTPFCKSFKRMPIWKQDFTPCLCSKQCSKILGIKQCSIHLICILNRKYPHLSNLNILIWKINFLPWYKISKPLLSRTELFGISRLNREFKWYFISSQVALSN